MIKLEKLTKTFGSVVAVDRLDVSVAPGEIFGFIGPNGAGKTTTIKMLSGVTAPSSGNVTICDIDMRTAPEKAKQHIGYIPDRPYLYEKLTGMEFMRFTADLYRMGHNGFEKKAWQRLKQFALDDWGHELIEAYSHGMKQRLIMAAALLHNPAVIIVDEPMVGLDPAGIKMVKQLFKNLAQEGKTIFMSTHTLRVAEEVCSRFGIINKGRLIAGGTVRQLSEQARAIEADFEDVFIKLTQEPLVAVDAANQERN